MRIKKFVVSSMPDAMQQIRTELGNNAIILNTKMIKTGGWFGFFSKQQIEVIAAVDQEKKVQDQQQVSTPTKSKPEALKELPIDNQENHEIEEKQVLAHVIKEDVLLQEIRQMKRVMSNWISEKVDQLPVPVQEINDLLKKQEVTKPLRTELIAKVLSEYDSEQLSLFEETVFDTTRRHISQLLQTNETTHRACIFKAKMICFVGPTGVGKTTTIAKLAADLMLKQKKKVGLITSDTYRIAAVEQLKTYAGILQLPIEVVFSPDDLKEAMDKLQDCDIILMDTAGRNYKQQQYISELRELIPDQDDIQLHMVLSLTTKYEDMVQIVDQFQQIKLNGFILTKLDETNSYGTILNLLHRYPVPLSYITNGQNVPDDIIVATPETITDLMLGEFAHERSS